MSNLHQYSTFFSTIYDEQDWVGFLGRGTHYSVLRSVEWLDVVRKPARVPQVHDFAVVWDEDHDERVIDAIERLYFAGLLSPVQFVGERKGNLTVVVAARFYWIGSDQDIESYRNSVFEIAQNLDADSWCSNVGSFDRSPGSPHQTFAEGLINDTEHKVNTYLRNIDNLWNLGTVDFDPRKHGSGVKITQ